MTRKFNLTAFFFGLIERPKKHPHMRRAFVLASKEWEPSNELVPKTLLVALKSAGYRRVIADKGSSKPDQKAHLRDAVVIVSGDPTPQQLISLCQTLRMLRNEPIVVSDGIGSTDVDMVPTFKKLQQQGIAILTIEQLLPLLPDNDMLAKAKFIASQLFEPVQNASC